VPLVVAGSALSAERDRENVLTGHVAMVARAQRHAVADAGDHLDRRGGDRLAVAGYAVAKAAGRIVPAMRRRRRHARDERDGTEDRFHASRLLAQMIKPSPRSVSHVPNRASIRPQMMLIETIGDRFEPVDDGAEFFEFSVSSFTVPCLLG